MKTMTVHDKAIRLLEGGIVEIDGNWFRLRRLNDEDGFTPCTMCNLDSACREEHIAICEECDAISGKVCCLQWTYAG